MTRDERILRDLSRHLHEKVIRNIDDFVALSMNTDLDMRDVMVEIMTSLLQLTASFAASQFNISTVEFTKAAIHQYQRAQKQQAQENSG